MSNNNAFWGKRFGYSHKDGTMALVKRQLSSGISRAGTSQNSAETIRSKRDKERFKLLGRPTMHVTNSGRRSVAY